MSNPGAPYYPPQQGSGMPASYPPQVQVPTPSGGPAGGPGGGFPPTGAPPGGAPPEKPDRKLATHLVVLITALAVIALCLIVVAVVAWAWPSDPKPTAAPTAPATSAPATPPPASRSAQPLAPTAQPLKSQAASGNVNGYPIINSDPFLVEGGWQFVSPAGTTRCFLSGTGDGHVSCLVKDGPNNRSCPASAPYFYIGTDYGNPVEVQSCTQDPGWPASKTLPYEKVLVGETHGCMTQESGITCVDANGSGFTVSRSGYVEH